MQLSCNLIDILSQLRGATTNINQIARKLHTDGEVPNDSTPVSYTHIRMYRDMITCMKENGITPYITMFHWEFPQALYETVSYTHLDVYKRQVQVLSFPCFRH